MTAPLRGSQRFSGIPASQNSAPVHEFRALFTHDIRRKQKRWQDGYLKFHTFNNRVMVYDQSRNFLGDTYYKESNELHEGDELTLDKGVMVEVAEAMGVTQTDLTPLFEKKKESPQRPNAAAVQKSVARATIPASNPLRAASQLRHKSLNALLGTHKGPTGKAMPMQSPFEARKEKENQCAEERASKRQKTIHEPVGQKAPQRTDSREGEGTSAKALSLWTRTSDARHNRTPTRPLPRGATVISLDSETDNILSDVTLPSTPPGIVRPVSRPKAALTPKNNQDTMNPPPGYATPKLPKGKVPVPSVKAQQTPQPHPQPSSPPISASNRLSNVDFAIESVQPPQKQPSPVQSPPRKPKAKSLRLSTGVKRGVLLCQSMLERDMTPVQQTRPPMTKETCPRDSGVDTVSLPHNDGGDSQSVQRSKSTKPKKTGPDAKRKGPAISASASRSAKSAGNRPAPQPSPDLFDDMEFIHGLMDQQLVVVSSPSESCELPVDKSPTPPIMPAPKPVTTKKAPSKRKISQDYYLTDDPAPKAKKAKPVATKETGKEAGKKKRKKADETPAEPLKEHTESHPRDVSISPFEPPESVSRNTSASVSPTKTALSTGGFRKRAKQPPLKRSKPEAPEVRHATVVLPPYPLRANRSGPLMTTTELSALLQKPNTAANLEDDPIEDGTQGTRKASPNKSFQRSRSENDAPIPSTSGEWEERNLPKSSASNKGVTNPTTEQEAAAQRPKAGGLAALVKKTDPRRKFQRTQSLNVNTNVPNIEEPEVVTPPADDDVGPWSTEAFDLFDWRPPDMQGPDRGFGILVDKTYHSSL